MGCTAAIGVLLVGPPVPVTLFGVVIPRSLDFSVSSLCLPTELCHLAKDQMTVMRRPITLAHENVESGKSLSTDSFDQFYLAPGVMAFGNMLKWMLSVLFVYSHIDDLPNLRRKRQGNFLARDAWSEEVTSGTGGIPAKWHEACTGHLDNCYFSTWGGARQTGKGPKPMHSIPCVQRADRSSERCHCHIIKIPQVQYMSPSFCRDRFSGLLKAPPFI